MHEVDGRLEIITSKVKVFKTEMMPELTVIMIARNSELTLRTSLKSALLSLPKNSKILLLLDDCSDRSAEIAKSIKDTRLQIFESRVNLGVAEGRNFLLNKVSTPLFAVLDSDDMCMPWRFVSQLREMDRTQVDFLFSTCFLMYRIKGFPVLLPQLPLKLTEPLVKLWLAVENPFVHSSFMGKTEVVKRIGAYRKVDAAEDYSLWLRGASWGFTFRQTNSYAVAYRIHASQISQGSSWNTKLNLTQNELQLRNELTSKLVKHNLISKAESPVRQLLNRSVNFQIRQRVIRKLLQVIKWLKLMVLRKSNST